MNLKIKAKGHSNITAQHHSTFEITTDKTLTKAGDCIIGLDMDKTMLNFPEDFKEKLRNDDTNVRVCLKTENGYDEICGKGDHRLPLNHLTDIVIRKSDFICSRTLMIHADKAASDLDRNLINDLANFKDLYMEIILE
ncbi:DUF371 domain-containing protein [Methanobrevibacter sp.]